MAITSLKANHYIIAGIILAPLLMLFIGVHDNFLSHQYTASFVVNSAMILAFHFLPSLILFPFIAPTANNFSKLHGALCIVAVIALPILIYSTGMGLYVKNLHEMNHSGTPYPHSYKVISPETIIVFSLWLSLVTICFVKIPKTVKIITVFSLLTLEGFLLFCMEYTGLGLFISHLLGLYP